MFSSHRLNQWTAEIMRKHVKPPCVESHNLDECDVCNYIYAHSPANVHYMDRYRHKTGIFVGRKEYLDILWIAIIEDGKLVMTMYWKESKKRSLQIFSPPGVPFLESSWWFLRESDPFEAPIIHARGRPSYWASGRERETVEWITREMWEFAQK